MSNSNYRVLVDENDKFSLVEAYCDDSGKLEHYGSELRTGRHETKEALLCELLKMVFAVYITGVTAPHVVLTPDSFKF